MTKHTRTAPAVSVSIGESASSVARCRRQADAILDAAAPLRYVPSMGKRLAKSEWSEPMKRDARKALIAWNKP